MADRREVEVDGSVNYNHSDWFRSTNTYLFNSNLNSGITVDLENNGDGVIKVTPSHDLNDLEFLELECAAHPAGAARGLAEGRAPERSNGATSAFKHQRRRRRQDNFHREVTTWDLTNCATERRCHSARRAAIALARRRHPARRTLAVPNAQLGNFMQPWTHGPLYNTSDFDVGLNNGWALPNYRLLDRGHQHRLLRAGARRADCAGGINARRLAAARTSTEETTGMLSSRRTAQLEMLGNLRYNVGIRYVEHGSEVAGIVTVRQSRDSRAGRHASSEFQRNDTEYHKYLPSFNVASDLNDKPGPALRGVEDDDPPAAGRHRAERVAERQRRHADAAAIRSWRRTSRRKLDLGLEWYFGDDGLGVIAIERLGASELEGYTSIVGTRCAVRQLGYRHQLAADRHADGQFRTAANAQCGCTASNDPNIAPVRVNQRQNTAEVITLVRLRAHLHPAARLPAAGFRLRDELHPRRASIRPVACRARRRARSRVSRPTRTTSRPSTRTTGSRGACRTSVRDAFVAFLGNNEQNIAGDNFAQKSALPRCVVQLQAADGDWISRSAWSCRTSPTSSC